MDDSWLLSPSGSGAQEIWPDITYDDFDTFAANDVYTSEGYGNCGDQDYALSADSYAAELAPGQLMSAKIPPAFNGRGSWFAFEELVYDWMDITILDQDKQGPALRNRLCDDALVYKPMLDRELLKDKTNGVEYFLKTIRPNFVKGVQHVFLYRLMQFLCQRRQKLDIHRWIAKFELQKKRLFDSWMDLIVPLKDGSPKYAAFLAMVDDYCAEKSIARPTQATMLLQLVNEIQTVRHKQAFPFSDNLLTLIFIIFSQLQDQQRLLLTQHMTMKQIVLEEYDFSSIRSWFIEILCNARSSIEDPSVRDRRSFAPRARTFIVIDEGECEGCYGVWAEDFETGCEGFLEPFEDCFWILDDTTCSWIARRFQGRRYVRGRPRGKGKGKKGRSRFRRKGKGKGKGHPYASMPDSYWTYDPYGSDSQWGQDWSNWNDKFDYGMWTDQEWWNHSWDQQQGPSVNADSGQQPSVNMDAANAAKGKSKGKGKFKGKPPFGKGKPPFKGFGKGKPKGDSTNAINTQPVSVHTLPAGDQQSTTPGGYTAESVHSPSVNADQQWHDWSWGYDQWWTPTGFLNRVHESGIEQCSFNTADWRPYAYSTDKELNQLEESLQVIDLKDNPMCVIMDLGCTRSMGSRRAVEAFIAAAWKYGIKCEWKRCWTRMSFANSDSEWLEWCVVVWFPTEPPVCTTIDVHENGNIPILLSLPQMMNLGLDLKLRPNSVRLTCAALDYHNECLPFTNSKHVALDLSRIKGNNVLDKTKDSSVDALAEQSFSVNADQVSHCQYADATTEVPTEPSEYQSDDDDHEWSDGALAVQENGDESAFPVQRRLRGKTTVRKDRAEAGPPVPKAKSKKPKAKSSVKVKNRGDPDASIRVQSVDPEPLVDGHVPGQKGVDMPKSKKKPSGVDMPKSGDKQKAEPDGTGPSLTTTLEKIHAKLRNKLELYKLHLKHYHMPLSSFKKRTSQLKIPQDIYDLYQSVVTECASCQKHAPAPERSKVTGMRAEVFGDLWFVDHVDISVDEYIYILCTSNCRCSNQFYLGCTTENKSQR